MTLEFKTFIIWCLIFSPTNGQNIYLFFINNELHLFLLKKINLSNTYKNKVRRFYSILVLVFVIAVFLSVCLSLIFPLLLLSLVLLSSPLVWRRSNISMTQVFICLLCHHCVSSSTSSWQHNTIIHHSGLFSFQHSTFHTHTNIAMTQLAECCNQPVSVCSLDGLLKKVTAETQPIRFYMVSMF